MARVLLLYPSIMEQEFGELGLPLSTLYIASALEKKGHEVRFIEGRYNPGWKEEFEDQLINWKPLCVGVSSMTGPQLIGAVDATKMTKKLCPSAKIVWGGVHASLVPKKTMESGYPDMIVVGEGEETFVNLVYAIEHASPLREVSGIWYRQGGDILYTSPAPLANVNEIPEPAYHLVDMEKYIMHPGNIKEERVLPLVTSRGCTFRCGFCYNLQFNQQKWRATSAKQVVEQIKKLVSQYNLTGIYLRDDLFFINRHRVKKICELIIRENLSLDFYNADIRADYICMLDKEYLELLRKAGFKTFYVGAESGSQYILDKLHKDLTVEQILKANQVLKGTGIDATFGFMGGLPFERDEDIRATLKIIAQIKKDNPKTNVGYYIFVPYPGTPLFDLGVREGWTKLPERLEEWNFDWQNPERPWLSIKKRKLLKDISNTVSFCLCLNPDRYGSRGLKIGKKNPFNIILFRIKHNFFGMLFERYLIAAFMHLNIRRRGILRQRPDLVKRTQSVAPAVEEGA